MKCDYKTGAYQPIIPSFNSGKKSNLTTPVSAVEKTCTGETDSLPSPAEKKIGSDNHKNILDARQRLNFYPKNINFILKIDDSFPAEQTGHICKITALANVDNYYSQHYSVENIPSRKNKKLIYPNELNQHTKSKDASISVRELAKNYDSVQGEILRFEDLKKIANDMGYSTNTISPKSPKDFSFQVTDQLLKGKPLVAFFAVEKNDDELFGLPTPLFDNNEHACLIVGVNTKNETIVIAHWGMILEGIPIDIFFNSMCALPSTRQQEFYIKTGQTPNSRSYVKYEPLPSNRPLAGITNSAQAPNTNTNTIIKSITPEENTGFNNKLLVLTPDLSNERWARKTTDKSIPYRSKNGTPEISLNSHVSVNPNDDEANTKHTGNARIWCRHFAQSFAEHAGKKSDLMHELSTYSGIHEKFNHSLNQTDEAFEKCLNETPATNRHVVENQHFGFYLEALANALTTPNNLAGNVSTANCLLLTRDHAMALHVEKKNKNGKDYFAVKLYDPNTTASYLRVEREKSNDLIDLKLSDFILRQNDLKHYADHPSNQADVCVVALSIDKHIKPIFNRKLAKPTATNIFLAMRSRSLEDLKDIMEGIIKSPITIDEKITLFEAKSEKLDMPGLGIALAAGYTEIVDYYIQMILQLRNKANDLTKKTRIFSILLASPGEKCEHKMPGLQAAFQFGRAETIKVFSQHLLAKKSPLSYSILATTHNGKPGLYYAFENNHLDTLRQFTESILSSTTLGLKHKIDLLKAQSAHGIPGLSLAFENGQTETVKIFTQLVMSSRLQPSPIVELLMAKRKNGSTGVQMALKNGHTTTVNEFKTTVLESRKLRSKDIASLFA